MPCFKHILSVCLLLLAVLGGFSGSAQSADTLQFSLGTAVGNPGDTVEIPVTLNAGNTPPSTFILWIRYNPQKITPNETYYQFTQDTLLPSGSGTVTTSFARPGSAVTDTGRFLQTNISQPGTLAVLVTGASDSPLPNGLVLTLAFAISTGASDGEVFAVDGLVEGEAAATIVSSAATADAQDIPVQVSDGAVTVGCSPAPNVNGVTASSDRSDGVLVEWNAVSGTGIEYRVYRNTVNSAITAAPIGDAWQSGTSFLDTTAAKPTINDPGGCFRGADFTPFVFFYWVKARTAEGCNSENFSNPVAQGSRTLAAKSGTSTLEASLPAKRATASAIAATPQSPLAVRLDAGAEAVDSSSVWARVQGSGWVADSFAVTPANTRGALWVSVHPDGAWQPGERIIFETSAASVSGAPVGPHVVEFVVQDAGKYDEVLPLLPEGVGEVYNITPEGVYDTPQTVRVPVPAGYAAQALEVYYYAHSVSGGAWVPANSVDGFLVARAHVADAGRQYVELTVRHSATLQLGTSPAPGAVIQDNTATMGSPLTPRSLADIAMFLLVLALLAGFRLVAQPRFS